jgi:hypothetical protein
MGNRMGATKWIGSGLLILAMIAGCSEQTEEAPAPQPPEGAVSVPDANAHPQVMRLPVSLNTVMVAMVNQAADPIWVAAWHSPETDKDWRELERRAIQLELGGTLLGVPGTGPLDDTWTANPDWQKWSEQLRNVGARAVQAVKARDIGKISAVGDQIVEICEGCHMDFKLALPTGGEFGELSPTAVDLEGDQ